MRNILLFLIYTNIFLYGNGISITSREEVDISKFTSIQWIQSDEYNLLCYQIYQSAKNNINNLMLNKSFSTMLEQNHTKNLPPAIVTDIDETILSNLEFQKELLKKGEAFSYDAWEKYIKRKTATAITGAINYYRYLSKKGIKIIYISNRTIRTKEETFELLKELGYPIEKENLLLQYEKEDWNKNKASRRAYIAKKYRVIQMFGDHLGDFVETNEEAIANKDKFGKSWFLLPNPMYGTWLDKRQ